MDEAGLLLERLRRIEALTFDGRARSGELLEELRTLVPAAEQWARSEGDRRAAAAAAKLREGAEGMR
jgi:Tfp pilus assembly protein PilN